MVIIRVIWRGRTSDLRGDPNSTIIGSRRDLKLHIFGAEGAENFEKMKGLKEKLALLWSFKRKFGQILINIIVSN